jgi:hypothetical protein
MKSLGIVEKEKVVGSPRRGGRDVAAGWERLKGKQREGDGSQETGDRRQETGDRRQETGDRRQETGDRSGGCFGGLRWGMFRNFERMGRILPVYHG